MPHVLALSAIAVVALASTACGTTASPHRVVVFAAASLAPAFTDLADTFSAQRPGAGVELSTAASSQLAEQLIHGANAGVFAAADRPTMEKVVRAGLVAGRPVDIAANTLVIAVAPGNPERIDSLADLARPELDVVVCAPPVPCGAAARRVTEAAGVRIDPASEESSVTDVLNKVASRQADAGLVYRTDVLAAGDRVGAVPVPEAADTPNIYSIAVLHSAADAGLARAFVDVVTGPAGLEILQRAGFAAP